MAQPRYSGVYSIQIAPTSRPFGVDDVDEDVG